MAVISSPPGSPTQAFSKIMESSSKATSTSSFRTQGWSSSGAENLFLPSKEQAAQSQSMWQSTGQKVCTLSNAELAAAGLRQLELTAGQRDPRVWPRQPNRPAGAGTSPRDTWCGKDQAHAARGQDLGSGLKAPPPSLQGCPSSTHPIRSPPTPTFALPQTPCVFSANVGGGSSPSGLNGVFGLAPQACLMAHAQTACHGPGKNRFAFRVFLCQRVTYLATCCLLPSPTNMSL